MTAHEYIEKMNDLMYYKEYTVYPRSQPLEYNIPLEDEIINLIKYYNVTIAENRASGGSPYFLLQLVYRTEITCHSINPLMIIDYSVLVNGGIPVGTYPGYGTFVINVKTKEIELWVDETIAPMYKPDITRCALNGEKFLDASYRLFYEDIEFWKNYSGNPNKFGKKLHAHMVKNIPIFAKVAGSKDYQEFWTLCIEIGNYELAKFKPY